MKKHIFHTSSHISLTICVTFVSLLIGIILCTSCAVYGSADPTGRVKYNFNSGWRVLTADSAGAKAESFDDSSWKSVTLPYGWNEHEAFKKDIHDLTTGI